MTLSILEHVRDEIRHLFDSCHEEPAPAPVPDQPAPEKIAVATIAKGDTLWGITKKVLTRGDVPGNGARWVELRPLNPRLQSPGAELRIQPGDVLRIPADWLV